jgi:hypothetical protein
MDLNRTEEQYDIGLLPTFRSYGAVPSFHVKNRLYGNRVNTSRIRSLYFSYITLVLYVCTFILLSNMLHTKLARTTCYLSHNAASHLWE